MTTLRNLIIGLVIVAVGVKLLVFIGTNALPRDSTGVAAGFLTGLTGMGDTIVLVCVLLALLLVPFYLSARGKVRKEARP